MDDVQKLQYDNLRNCVNENLITPILGENYYNYGMDVYTCDEITTLDIQQHFYELKLKGLFYKMLTIIGFGGWLIYAIVTYK